MPVRAISPATPRVAREGDGRAGVSGPGARPAGTHGRPTSGDVMVSVRVFDHGGSAVVARSARGGIDAVVR